MDDEEPPNVIEDASARVDPNWAWCEGTGLSDSYWSLEITGSVGRDNVDDVDEELSTARAGQGLAI